MLSDGLQLISHIIDTVWYKLYTEVTNCTEGLLATSP